MFEDLNEVKRQRLQKLEYWRGKGVNPYGYSFQATGTVEQLLKRQKEGSTGVESVAGRVTSVREHGKSVFMDLEDWTGRMQIYGKIDSMPGQFELFKNLEVGDIIGAEGAFFTTKRGEVTLLLSRFELLSKSIRSLPEKYHGLKDTEIRYRKRYLDFIVNPESRAVAVKRIKIIRSVRDYFESMGYVEVETPVLERIASGAAAKPFVTHSNALDQDLYLRIALELSLKRLIIGGFPKVYEIGRVFRNEDIDSRHNPEFTMLEAYEAYTDYNGMMDLVEKLFEFLLRETGTGSAITYQGKGIDFSQPWKRITMIDAIKASGIDIEYDEKYRNVMACILDEHKVPYSDRTPLGKMVVDVYEQVVQPSIVNPTFIMDFPKEVSPLTKVHRKDPRFAERFELYINGMEFANAYSELTDPIDQKARFIEQAKQKTAGVEDTFAIDEDFIEAMEYGMPPTGGIGIGIDRVVMLLTDQPSIKEVLLFPQMKSL